MDTLKYTKQRIIKALKDAAEKWAVVAAGPINYFSDGSVIVSCEEAEGDNLSGHLVAAWVRGVTRYTKAVVPDGYSPAESSQLYGMFGKNYVRLFKRPDSDDVTFLAERYVRAVDDGCAAWMRTTEDPVYFLRPDCQAIAAVIMPVRDKTNSNPKLSEYPLVPFLEDAVLYHDCDDEDEYAAYFTLADAIKAG